MWLELGVPALDVYVPDGVLLLPRAGVPGLAAFFHALGSEPRILMIAAHGQPDGSGATRAELTAAIVAGAGWAPLAAQSHSARELAAYLRWAADEFAIGSAVDESLLEDANDGPSGHFSGVFGLALADFRTDFNERFEASIPEGEHVVAVEDWEALESLLIEAIAARLARTREDVEHRRESLSLAAAVDCRTQLKTPQIRDFSPCPGARVDVLAFSPGTGADLEPASAAQRVYSSEELTAKQVEFVVDHRHHRSAQEPREVEVVVHDAVGRPLPGVRVRNLSSAGGSIAETDDAGLVRFEVDAAEESARVSIVDYEPKKLSDLAATSATPSPGKFYPIQAGDSLLEVVGRAYGLSPGASRLERAQQVNANPWNRHYWVEPRSDFNTQHFSDGVISFMPAWDGSITREDQAGLPGQDFCLIYLPEGLS